MYPVLAPVLALLPGLVQVAPGAAQEIPRIPTEAELARLAEQYGERWTAEARTYCLAGPAVVSVEGYRRRLGALTGVVAGRPVSQGSGVVIDREGFVVTNAHVVAPDEQLADDQLACRVAFSPEFGGASFDAALIALDREWDLALLKILATADFPALELRAQDDVLIGEKVLVMGSPLGSFSLTTGILSGLGRDILVMGVRSQHRLNGVLQTDAAINPGNSGGPLLNVRGDLIGITSATLRGAQGISYAIPAARVRQVLETRLYRPKVWLGMGMVPNSLVVDRVHPRGPAALAGLRGGDRIVGLEGEPLAAYTELQRGLLMRRAGESVLLAYERPGAGGTAAGAIARLDLMPEDSRWQLGILGFRPSEEQLKLPVPSKQGDEMLRILRVEEVYRGSGAAALGLESGDTIIAVRLRESSESDGWMPVQSRTQLLDYVQGGKLEIDGLNLWWLKADGTSLKGRLTFDDPWMPAAPPTS